MYDLIKNNIIIFSFGLYSSFFVQFDKDMQNLNYIFPNELDIRKNRISYMYILRFSNNDNNCYENLIEVGFSPEGYMVSFGKESSSKYIEEPFTLNKYEFNKNGSLKREILYFNREPNNISQMYITEYSHSGHNRTSTFEESIYFPKDDNFRNENNIPQFAKSIFELDSTGKILRHQANNVTASVRGNWYTYYNVDYFYDSVGRLIHTSQTDTVECSKFYTHIINYHRNDHWIKYDSSGNVSEIKEGSGFFSIPVGSSKAISNILTIDSLQIFKLQKYFYDKYNRLTKKTNKFLNENPVVSLKLEYDTNGQLIKESIPMHDLHYIWLYNNLGLPIEKQIVNRDGKISEKFKIYYSYY